MGLVPLQAALKGPTSTISPHLWEWILGAATPWGHGQGTVALEQYLKGVAAQAAARQSTVAARQSTVALEAPGAGQAGAEPPSRYGSCASTTDTIHGSWAVVRGSWAVFCGSWAAAGPQQF